MKGCVVPTYRQRVKGGCLGLVFPEADFEIWVQIQVVYLGGTSCTEVLKWDKERRKHVKRMYFEASYNWSWVLRESSWLNMLNICLRVYPTCDGLGSVYAPTTINHSWKAAPEVGGGRSFHGTFAAYQRKRDGLWWPSPRTKKMQISAVWSHAGVPWHGKS